MKKHRVLSQLGVFAAALVSALVSAPAALAADTPPEPLVVAAADTDTGKESTTLDQVIVTGTRTKGLQAAESPAPVQIISAETLKSAGQPDLIGALAQIVPSFTAQSFGGDQANQTLSAKLRGVSPNHALVLINGKRRHSTANIAVLNGPFQGSATADLNFIPISAVKRVEVLTDGAAAQYGSDAIAGVINIILKDKSEGGSIDSTYGGYKQGGGDTVNFSGNVGFGSGPDAFLNLTGEYRTRERSDRGGIDPRVVDPGNIATFPNSNVLLAPGYPYLNHIQGDPEVDLYIGSYNAGYTLGGIDFYSVGTYGIKKANSFENYRLPSRAAYTPTDDDGNATGPTEYFYPFGFNPKEAADEEDFAFTFGAKGTVFGGWNWDLSTSYGKDELKIFTLDSLNLDLYAQTGTSPTDFFNGVYATQQLTTNFDLVRNFEVGLAEPLSVAVGAEQRYESYEQKIGDAASRFGGGGSSFPGIQPADAGKHGRDNVAFYADLATSPIKNLQVDLAGRFEHFTDFGNTVVGKLTARYEFTSAIALRGTVSSGFRAPTLGEEFYSATNVGPISTFAQLAPNSSGAGLLGLGTGLKAEKSTNFSLGLVMHPLPKLTATIDAYQIQIRDRIVGSGALYSIFNGVPVPGADAIAAALLANNTPIDPAAQFVGVQLFANGLTTRTRGIDLVLSYPSTFVFGSVDWSASANYNKTKITKLNASPAELGGQALYNETAQSDLETASPEFRLNFAAVWSLGKFSATARETIYGPSSERNLGDDNVYYTDKIKTTPITDLELSFKPVKNIKFSLGAINLFDIQPQQRNAQLLQSYRDAGDNSAVQVLPQAFSPFGFNGGYYYAKLGYSF